MIEQHERPIVVVAMGGHAFINKGETGSHEDHLRNANSICSRLMKLIERDYNVVITHGNGPQVGNLLLSTEASRGVVPELPLDALVAQTEGSLGYLLQQALTNQLRRRRIERDVVTMVTQVLVEPQDPSFRKPSKPIGPFMDVAVARERAERSDWAIADDPEGRGWRRLVASPKPREVLQRNMIRQTARAGHIVIACGGGGVPVIEDENGDYQGVEVVIDKDLTSSILASNIKAELLIILTAVPHVYLHFGTDKQKHLGALTLDEVEDLVDAGHFPAGSMGPKVEAVRDFLRSGGTRGLITNPESLHDALSGRAGTHFVGRI